MHSIFYLWKTVPEKNVNLKRRIRSKLKILNLKVLYAEILYLTSHF
jgi:hypothetical protein